MKSIRVLELGVPEFNLLKDRTYKIKNLEKLNVHGYVSVNYGKLSKNNPGIKFIRQPD